MSVFWRIFDLLLAIALSLIFLPIYLALMAKDKLSGGDDPE